jgi:hypothetical protein
MINILNKNNNGVIKFGGVVFTIQITQHNRSIILLEEINKFLRVGKIYYSYNPNKNVSLFKITKVSDINYFINLFSEAQLHGAKALDYSDFCRGINLVNLKLHFTEEGQNELKQISANMNTGRTNFE